jgi:hypothetical protein
MTINNFQQTVVLKTTWMLMETAMDQFLEQHRRTVVLSALVGNLLALKLFGNLQEIVG